MKGLQVTPCVVRALSEPSVKNCAVTTTGNSLRGILLALAPN